ncbi:MAG: hypothetical protein PHH19_02865 [Eubacteriales bacterium]|jgi:hypothetical protein|nr:hypothetical protein [Eubacteriales bacterium]
MNFLSDSFITILIMILFFSIMTLFFNYGRKIRMSVRKKKLIKKAHELLELDELPLHKNKEINWEMVERKAKKLPDSRDKYMFVREVRDQIQFSKIVKK